MADETPGGFQRLNRVRLCRIAMLIVAALVGDQGALYESDSEFDFVQI